MEEIYDLLLLVADRREVHHLLKTGIKQTHRLYTICSNSKKVAIYITGVGKHSIKRSLPEVNTIAKESKLIVNVGNAGSLKTHKYGDIIQVGQVIGANGKEKINLDSNASNVLVTVNSIQNKSKLASQYREADLVDMELFLIAKKINGAKLTAYKIVLDTFNINPKRKLIRLFLPVFIRMNSKKLSNFIKNRYLF